MMTEKIANEDIEAIECRFAVHCPTPQDKRTDLHLVKELIHLKDGRKIPNVRIIENFKRSFWITKKGFRNHKEKKESEYLEKVDEFKTTQTELPRAILKALGEGWKDERDLRRICQNPYVYGADILSTALIKHAYQKRYPIDPTPFSVAGFDTETDVNGLINEHNEIIIATLSMKERVFTAINKKFVEGYADVHQQLMDKLNLYLGEYVKKRNIQYEVVLVDTEIDIVKSIFSKANEWKPDFVEIWNITFDMKKILEACERAGVDPKDVFCDPSVPPDYRFFEFVKGKDKKVTASGKTTPIKSAARWHTVYCPTSYYFIDGMCTFRHVRTGEPEEQSYSLDSILEAKLGIRKLKFDKAKEYEDVPLLWHQFMQKNYHLEYVIYNVFDCISMEELDEKIQDISLTFPMLSKCSDFANFKSQPRRLVDDLHFFFLESEHRVIGTTSNKMATEDDEETVGLNDLIVMLPAELVVDNGLKLIEEDPNLSTNIRAMVAD